MIKSHKKQEEGKGALFLGISKIFILPNFISMRNFKCIICAFEHLMIFVGAV